MKNIKYYQDINEFLSELGGIPLLKCENFYIVKFEGNYNSNYQTACKHDYFEINLVVGFDALVNIGEYEMNPLEYNLSFISPGQIGTWNVQGFNSDFSGYMILFKPSFLISINDAFNIFENFPYFNHFTSPGYKLNNRQLNLFQDLFQKIYQEYDSLTEDSLEIIKAYLLVFLYKAKRELAFDSKINSFKNRYHEITYNFENLIIQTNQKYQSISYYANELNISSVYLSECIKKATAKTTKHIINEYVILEAKSFLKQTTKLISEIAYSLGFDDESNFVKYFKKHTGRTPKQFRLDQ